MDKKLQALPVLLKLRIHNSSCSSTHAIDCCRWHRTDAFKGHVQKSLCIIQASCTALQHLAQLSRVAGGTDAALIYLHKGQCNPVQHLVNKHQDICE